MSFFEFLKRIDIFPKVPEFYFKGKPKHVTIVGSIFTYVYIAIIIIIFCYKIYRLTKRLDVTFYDYYSDGSDPYEIPKIKITDDNFTLMFSILYDDTIPFIDTTIYYPVVFFFDEKIKYLDVEKCDPNKMTQELIDKVGESEIENYYCVNNIDLELVPLNTGIVIEIYPCKDYYEGENYCQPKEVIDYFLNYQSFDVYFRDIQITPLNFENPVKKEIRGIRTQIYKGLGQRLSVDMQRVKIETSTDILGLDFLTEPKTEQFLKFESEEILPYPGYNLDDEENQQQLITLFNLHLNDKILFEKRHYTQLIDVFGEIGGLMGIINSFFGIICSLIIDIIYEKTITNELFSFNIDKKLMIFKKVNNPIFQFNEVNKFNTIENKNIADSKINSIKIKKNEKTENEITLIEINKDKNKVQKNSGEINNFNNDTKTINPEIESIKDSCRNININNNELKMNKTDRENENNFIIENINLTDIFKSIFHCCPCWKKNRKNYYNILINESINVFREKLDILNIFRNICSIEYINCDENDNLKTIKMTKECSQHLSEIMGNKIT